MNPRFEPKHILAIDFDLTICMSDYPKLGPIREGAKEAITKLYNDGFGIVVNTCREGHPLSDAMHWLKDNDIPYHYVNCNMYIDDKGVEELPSWNKIYKIISKKFKI